MRKIALFLVTKRVLPPDIGLSRKDVGLSCLGNVWIIDLCCTVRIDNITVCRYNENHEVRKMMIEQLLAHKGMTKYRLAKNTGIPYMTVNDICSGKTKLFNCTAATVRRLSKALDVTMEDLMGSESEGAADMESRNDFELFKSNVCHRVKAAGDMVFIVETLQSDTIRRYYDKKWYPEAFYLLAMVDYLSHENHLPLCANYNDIRARKLSNIVYPSGVLAMYAASKDDRVKTGSYRKAIPEFRRFNIVENEVRNVI